MTNNTNKRTAHIISHTHWDREWYLPYEKHHVRLIELMDTLMDTLESNPEYRSFFSTVRRSFWKITCRFAPTAGNGWRS